MHWLENARENIARFRISKKILGYGSIGIASAILIQFTVGFAADHPLMLALDIVLWTVFASAMAWVLWEFIVPMMRG